jgi:hypothetical protein
MICTRITYNTNRWNIPSGRHGKSQNIETHEGEFGFGFEEWLFNKRNTFSYINEEKFQYGYLEGINRNGTENDQNYELELFTINEINAITRNRTRSKIAHIKKWILVPPNESLQLVQIHEHCIDQMRHELNILADEADNAINRFNINVVNLENPQLFNIKFKMDDVILFENFIYPQNHPVYNLNRYLLYRNVHLHETHNL